MKSIIIKSGTIINGHGIEKADVLVRNGKIADVSPSIKHYPSGSTIIEAAGKYIIPGGVDPHVHFALQVSQGRTFDDFRSGSLAALSGGTTTIIDFITPLPEENLLEAFAKRKKEARDIFVDYALHTSVTSWRESIPDELRKCKDKGISSVKVYMAYTDSIGLPAEDIEKVAEVVADLNMVLLVHCEDDGIIKASQKELIAAGKTTAHYHPQSRPSEAEEKAVEKILEIAARTPCQLYIVHVSLAKSALMIAKAKESKISVMAETCPQYLLLDDSCYDKAVEKAANYVLSPPLRSAANAKDLWPYMSRGIFDTVGTDHCTFSSMQKNNASIKNFTDIPNGLAGVRNRLPLLYYYGVVQNRFSLKDFVRLTSTNAAKIFGLYPRKGIIATGADADIVIFNPNEKYTIDTPDNKFEADFCAYKGLTASNLPETVIKSGRIVYHNHNFTTQKVKGQFLKAVK